MELIITIDSVSFMIFTVTKLYGYDRNDDGIMLNKRIYWEHAPTAG